MALADAAVTHPLLEQRAEAGELAVAPRPQLGDTAGRFGNAVERGEVRIHRFADGVEVTEAILGLGRIRCRVKVRKRVGQLVEVLGPDLAPLQGRGHQPVLRELSHLDRPVDRLPVRASAARSGGP